jgi:hypothetical protein
MVLIDLSYLFLPDEMKNQFLRGWEGGTVLKVGMASVYLDRKLKLCL